jgi:hypothetical protein
MTTFTVCLENYTSKLAPRTPRSMDCGHTLCIGYIATMLDALPKVGTAKS